MRLTKLEQMAVTVVWYHTMWSQLVSAAPEDKLEGRRRVELDAPPSEKRHPLFLVSSFVRLVPHLVDMGLT